MNYLNFLKKPFYQLLPKSKKGLFGIIENF